MDNRVNKIRKEIRALRVQMLEAEATMREQVNQGESCAETAGQILDMRAQMSHLARERISLGDRELIFVGSTPRRVSAERTVVRPAFSRPAKRSLALR